ncbi:phosphogluconate dehydrogenase [Salix suchowensis]|nr:phosphogluconate dehydrogenase [Salix suchowensis]
MAPLTRIGLAGLAVMGQNLALNIAEKGFHISVYNRTTLRVDETVERAKQEGDLPLYGFHDPESFVKSIQKPRVIIMLVKAGAPVDQTIKTLSIYMEKGDCIIDGGNEWYENTERREKAMAELGLLYLGMGVSGGEDGARHGPSLMPGGSFKAYKHIEDILLTVAAQVPDSGPCVTYIGKGGSGNFVKMVHNGIEYGDMQLIAEACDVLKSVGKLTNEELCQVFSEWNKGELLSFLIEITADIFGIKDDKGEGYLVDKVLDKTGMKGTSAEKGWDLKLGELTRIWKGGCIIRAVFLDQFAREIIERQSTWRRVVSTAINSGISTPGMTSSLAYFDTYRRSKLPANLVQAQREYFGAHTYERDDMDGSFHTEWFKIAKQSKI